LASKPSSSHSPWVGNRAQTCPIRRCLRRRADTAYCESAGRRRAVVVLAMAAGPGTRPFPTRGERRYLALSVEVQLELFPMGGELGTYTPPSGDTCAAVRARRIAKAQVHDVPLFSWPWQ